MPRVHALRRNAPWAMQTITFGPIATNLKASDICLGRVRTDGAGGTRGEIPDGVDLWVASLTCSPRGLRRVRQLLSAVELRRLGRIANPRSRHLRILARSALREVLDRYLDTNAEAVPLVDELYGKPTLASGGPAFNLSHAGDLLAIAVAAGMLAVGIDNEMLGRRGHFPPPTRALMPTEAAACPRGLKEQAFLRCWTVKEAYAKGLGIGLGMELSQIEVRQTSSGPVLLGDRAGRWSLAYFDPQPGVIGAVAVREGGKG